MSSRRLPIEDNKPTPDRKRWCWIGLVVISLVYLCLATPDANAQGWPKMHHDPGNTGYQDNPAGAPGIGQPDPSNPNGDLMNPLELTWIYPWPASGNFDNADAIVDDQDTGSVFTTAGPWLNSNTLPNASVNAYNSHYWQVPVQVPGSSVQTATASWSLSAKLPTAAMDYQVSVWFPSSTTDPENPDVAANNITNTSHATYTINGSTGSSSVTINQTNGGQWVSLGTFKLNKDSTITLSNHSDAKTPPTPFDPGNPGGGDKYVDEGKYVVADAVRVVNDLGAIYCSPAVYTASVNGSSREVVFGTVERDPYKRDPEINWARIVCLDANWGPGRSMHPNSNLRTLNATLWTYPRTAAQRTSPVEGPIAGGVFSSPLVADTSVGKTVFVGADDGQIYALNAITGDLLWSGPGKTIDDTSGSDVSLSGFSPANASGDDYFGADYAVAPATKGADTHTATYNFTGLPLYYYSVYAWIPAPRAGEERITDASYTIVMDNGSVTIKVNQDLCSRMSGCVCASGSQRAGWVQVGASYLPKSDGTLNVALSSRTATDPCDAAATRNVVADAIRLVPDSIGAFGYCAPTADTVSGVISKIFCANANGRIISLDAVASGGYATNTNWIFPAVRQTTTGSDEVSLGGMSCTPAVAGEKLYYGTVTGNVGCVNNINGTPSNLPADGGWNQLSKSSNPLTSIGAITSSPMLDSTFVYFATASGRVYKASDSTGDVSWTYPDDWNGAPDPGTIGPPTAGAFRYSSPAKIDASGNKYIVVGSADGYLHRVPDAGPSSTSDVNDLKIQVPGSVYSSAGSAIKDIDPEAVYFGTNSSVFVSFADIDPLNKPLKWGWSTLAQNLYSSPAVADKYAYIGGDDGRLYAFAKRSVGGGWPINDPSIPPEPPGQRWDHRNSGGSFYFDLEVVTQQDYNDPETYLKNANVWANTGINRHPGGQMPTDSNGKVRLEWGDTIYVIAWTFENHNANIKFEFQNIGQGEQAGALLTASQTANLHYQQPVTVKINGVDQTGNLHYTKFAWVLDPNRLLTPGSNYIITGTLTPLRTSQSNPLGVTGTVTASVPLFGSNPQSFDSKRKPQVFQINHPLAISFPPGTLGGTPGPGWNAAPGQSFIPTRNDSGVDYNGMLTIPTLPRQIARHGGNTPPVPVYIADRSMLGYYRRNSQNIINTLRASRGDLGFPGNPINPLPWEQIPAPGLVNNSLDYPDLSRTQMKMLKSLDGADPTRGNAYLLPTSPPTSTVPPNTVPVSGPLNPDPLSVVVEVPRYQPADNPANPYGNRARVWVDSSDSGTHRGELDIADTRVLGVPLRGSEVYREWNYEMNIMPDYTMYAEQRTVDLGKRPIGFGEWTPDTFWPFAANPASSPFFQNFIIRNNGNVNLSNLRMYKNLEMYSDQVQALDFNGNGRLDPGEGFALSGQNIVSSLDPAFDSLSIAGMPVSWTLNGEPVYSGMRKGHVISKPRVGDTGPTTLEIPDRRQYEYLKAFNPNVPSPTLPMVSVKVPLDTPAGTYSQVVPVVAVMPSGDLFGYGQPATIPSFVLTASIREARMTDGYTSGSMPVVDNPLLGGTPEQWGDAQPAGYRLWSRTSSSVSTGPLGMLWVSNRFGNTDPAAGSQPWYLYNSILATDSFSSIPPVVDPPQWWMSVANTDSLPARRGGSLAAWFPGPPDGMSGSIVAGSEKFSSPSVAQDPNSGQTWAVFVGQVDKDTGGKITTEYRMFYGQVSSKGRLDSSNIQSVSGQDYTAPKFAPRLAISGNRMFLFWYVGLSGQYKIYYKINNNGGAPGDWSSDTVLPTPAAVTTASEPVGIPRVISPYFPSGLAPQLHVDVMYSGITRQGDNADVFLSRYIVSGRSLGIQRLPRVFAEELKHDAKSVSLFSSRHIAWLRPSNGQNPASAIDSFPYDFPIITVSRWNGTGYDPPDWVNNVAASVDSQSGLVVYDNETANPALYTRYGRIVVDTSAGTVKFEKPLGAKDRVVADYTPQTWRLTEGVQPDMSPFGFVENTLRPGHNVDRSIFPDTAVGPLSVNRLWMFWRQGAGAVHANTIYYRTMRLGLQLKHPIAVNRDGSAVLLEVYDGPNPYPGPYELDWANSRILFPEDPSATGGAENKNIWVRYTGSDQPPNERPYKEPEGFTQVENRYKALSWITELPETTLLVDSMVNEGQVHAFPDPDGLRDPADPLYKPSLIWVFWTSSRGGSSDIYYEPISPNFRAVTRQ